MEMNLFENYPNNKINFEEQWQSAEWCNLETHTQLLSKKKFTSFLLRNLQIWNSEGAASNVFCGWTDENTTGNRSVDVINLRVLFNR